MKDPVKIIKILAIVIAVLLVILIIKNLVFKSKNNLVQIANPLTEVKSVEEMKKYLGYKIPLIEGKEVEKYYVIGDKYAYHARIIYSDGSEFDMEKGISDVSGIYGGTLVKTETINNVKVNINKYDDLNYATWNKKGYSYSYSSENMDTLMKDIEKLI